MQVGRGVGELHEVAEVLDRAVAPAVVEVAHERRAVVRGEDRVHPADLDVALRVAGELGELARARSPGRSGGTSRAGSGRARRRRRRRHRGGAVSASGSPRNSMPTSSRIVSALCSMSDRPSSPRTSNGASLRVRNGTCSAWLARRSAWRAARPPLRRRCGSSIRRPPSCRSPRCAGVVVRCGPRRPGCRRSSPCEPAEAPRRRGAGTRPSCAGTPSPRRSAPGSAARRRSRSSRRAGRRLRSRVRAAPDSRAMSAPVPAALPAERTWARSQSGMSPRIIAWSGSIWLPKAPARRISSTLVDLELVHQQPDAGVERGLAELDRPDVVLGDRDPRPGRRIRRLRGGRS